MVNLANNKRKVRAAMLVCLATLFALSPYAGLSHKIPIPESGSASTSASGLGSSSVSYAASLVTEAGLTTASTDTAWPQLAHDPQRSSYVPTEVPGPWRLKWIWNGPAGGGDAGPASDHLRLPKGVQPITGDGKLYIGHSDGTVRAISEATGQQVWSFSTGGAVVNAGAYDPETNSVYFGSQNGNFYRLNAVNGQQQSVNRPGGQILMAPLLVGNSVYIGSVTGVDGADSTFYAFDKTTLAQDWSYPAGAALIASPAYSANHGGLIIILSEDKKVHALEASDGSLRWTVAVNADEDPQRGNTSFADTYPVVSDANDVVIVRSYLNWDKMWQPTGGAPSTVAEIRNYLTANPTLQSFFVLELSNGAQRFVAPVLVGAIGNGGDFESVPPQAVVKSLADGTEAAYLLWRSRQACTTGVCDDREDTTLGEMDLTTGNIRFVRDYKNQGTMRLPTDEQSPLSMAGDALFYAHWMTLGALRVTDRSPGLGGSYTNPIGTEELTPVLNTLASGSCSNRDSSNHYCPQGMYDPGGGYRNDPGFYVYYAGASVYDQYWTTPVRSAVIANGTIYWKTVDGAIIALQSAAAPSPPPSSKTASPAAARANDIITFTITVGGSGRSTHVTDTLPIQFTHLSATTTCPGTAGFNTSTRQITYSGTPSAGSSCVIQISTRANTDQIMAVTNTATVDNGFPPPENVSTTVILNGLPIYLPIILKSFR